MSGDDDRDLRERFAAERRREADEAPAFEGLWAAARRPSAGRRRLAPSVALATAAALLCAVGLLRVRTPAPATPPPTAPSVTAWRSPTDFLLRTPGLELLETLPAIGQPPPVTDRSPERRTSS